MKIVLTDCATVTNGDIDLSVLEKLGDVEYYQLTAPEELVGRICGADAVICNKTVISADIMKQCPLLKYIGLFATGYNNIDVEYAGKHGITVCNAGQYSTSAVAQHVFALLLEIYCSTSSYTSFTADGGWVRSRSFSAFGYPQHELFGKTIGIVGFGSIGRAVAAIARAFGMNVIAYTRTPREEEGVRMVSFEELLAQSDVISVHCPLTAQTEKMFDADAFAAMKDGAVFINTSRGGVLDEAALRAALEAGKPAAAAVDVLTTEPMSADCPLLGAPNLLITPHVAWAPYETRVRLMDIVYSNLAAYLDGAPINVVS